MSAPSRSAPSRPSRKEAKGPAREAGARCPICDKPVVHDHRPFCSKRCTDIDLGRWLKGRYAVPGAPLARGNTEADDE